MQLSGMVSISLIFAQLLACPAAGLLLRSADPAKPAEIKKKWDNMNSFVGEMATMACTWKHGKDINGLANVKLKNGELEGGDEYREDVRKIQDGNVKGVTKACGMIVSSQGKKCREGCAARWNENAGQREHCDDKCVSVYANFEKSCIEQGQNLATVYKQKRMKTKAQQECYEGYCNEFPSVWTKNSEDNMKIEIDEKCAAVCTKDSIKSGCQKKWALEVDSISSKVALACTEKSVLKKCVATKTKGASESFAKCQKDTTSTCDAEHRTCGGKKGKTTTEFCDERKKMCQDQANAKCLSENKAVLEKGKVDCVTADTKAMSTCNKETLEKQNKDADKACIAERGPKCKADCHGKCDVPVMNKCLAQGKHGDPGVQFCKDFWQLLHSSSEVDHVTGNPVFRNRQLFF